MPYTAVDEMKTKRATWWRNAASSSSRVPSTPVETISCALASGSAAAQCTTSGAPDLASSPAAGSRMSPTIASMRSFSG